MPPLSLCGGRVNLLSRSPLTTFLCGNGWMSIRVWLLGAGDGQSVFDPFVGLAIVDYAKCQSGLVLVYFLGSVWASNPSFCSKKNTLETY